MRQLLLALVLTLIVTANANAATGLVIYAAEIGVGKFHRMDNKIHKYDSKNIWSHFVMPDGAGGSLNETLVKQNPDGSVSIFFSNLEDLLLTSANLAKKMGTKVASLNINSHGLPGGLWFPKDKQDMNSWGCADWVQAAKGRDDDNYNQYYSPVSKSEIMSFRQMSQTAGRSFTCVVGAKEWKEVLSKHPEIKDAFDNGSAINILGCLVGLGKAGEYHNAAIASLLLSDRASVVRSITQFGLGDWSIPEGLSFWDYQNDKQLDHDNAVYPKNKTDREIAQKGTVRTTAFQKGAPIQKLEADQSFMALAPAAPSLTAGGWAPVVLRPNVEVVLPAAVRIPGTKFFAKRLN